MRILVVDDVITSGISKVPILNSISDHDGIPAGLFVFVNRMKKAEDTIEFEKKYICSMSYLLNLDNLLTQA